MTDPLPEIKARREAVESLPWSVNGPDAWNEGRWLVGPRIFPRDRTDVADMEFIARAPADIDTLIGEVERLGAVVDQFQAALSMAKDVLEAFFEDDDAACSMFTRNMLATAQLRIHDLLSPPEDERP